MRFYQFQSLLQPVQYTNATNINGACCAIMLFAAAVHITETCIRVVYDDDVWLYEAQCVTMAYADAAYINEAHQHGI